MTKLGKIIVSLVVVGAVIIGGKYWMDSNVGNPVAPLQEKDMSENVSKNEDTSEATLSKDSSDDSLDKDLLTIDAEIKASEQSSNDVDQGLNDKPVSQTE